MTTVTDPAKLNALSVYVVQDIGAHYLAILPGETVSKLSSRFISWLRPEQLQALRGEHLTADQLNAMGYETMQFLLKKQIDALSSDTVSKLDRNFLSWLKPGHLKALHAEHLTADQLNVMGFETVRNLSEEQIAILPKDIVSKLDRNFLNWLSRSQLQSLNPEHFTADQLNGMGYETVQFLSLFQISGLPKDTTSKLDRNFLNWLNHRQLEMLKTEHLTAAQLNLFGHDSLSQFSKKQLAAIEESVCASLTDETILKIGVLSAEMRLPAERKNLTKIAKTTNPDSIGIFPYLGLPEEVQQAFPGKLFSSGFLLQIITIAERMDKNPSSLITADQLKDIGLDEIAKLNGRELAKLDVSHLAVIANKLSPDQVYAIPYGKVFALSKQGVTLKTNGIWNLPTRAVAWYGRRNAPAPEARAA